MNKQKFDLLISVIKIRKKYIYLDIIWTAHTEGILC